jgi:hypothetical protein
LGYASEIWADLYNARKSMTPRAFRLILFTWLVCGLIVWWSLSRPGGGAVPEGAGRAVDELRHRDEG